MSIERRNILMVQLDQLSACSLSAYGNEVSYTPNIDRLAARSVVFDNAYCNFPVCCPSRASMMTGRLATRIGVYDNASELPATVPTIAHFLRTAGYRTILSGKMHFVGPDPLHGFEERLTPEIYSSDLLTLPDWSSPDVDEFASDAAETLIKAGTAPRTVQMDYDEEVRFAARQALFDLARSPDNRPFFLLASFTHPHDPYICREEDWAIYDSRIVGMPKMTGVPKDARDTHTDRIYAHYNLDDPRITPDLIQKARRAYFGSLTYADRCVGELISALDDVGLRDQTVIIFTSDHGDMLGERGMWFKKVFYENAVRVPLMIEYPGVAPGRRSQIVSLVDLLPTLRDIAHSDADPWPLDGESLLPLARSRFGNRNRAALAELTCEGVPEPVVMVRKCRYKLIHALEAGSLLYDLENDPDESADLSNDPSHAEVLADLLQDVETTWGDLRELKASVLNSQKRRRFVAAALEQGKFNSWDAHDPSGDGARYLRHGKSYNRWNYHGVDHLRNRLAERPERKIE